MAVTYEFAVGEGFHFSEAFANHFNTKMDNDRVWLPATLGEGFIQEMPLDNGLSLCMHSYVLKEPFVLRRLVSDSAAAEELLTLRFNCKQAVPGQDPLDKNTGGFEMELSTSNLLAETTLPAGKQINFLVITTSRKDLLNLLQLGEEDKVVTTLLQESKSFLLHEGMTTEIEHKLKQLNQLKTTTKLSYLLYQVKAQELIYLFFIKLLSRELTSTIPVNQTDADRIYEVRAAIINNLDTPPQLPVLAKQIGMSQTKMKQLFRQVFGDSIYNYYQRVRMEEAAKLLEHLSVSEAGYRIGFANLSHFARLFEKHFRLKPKKYQDALKRQLLMYDTWQ